MRASSLRSCWRGVALLVVALGVSSLFADDWPQWRGPNRDGVSKEKGLAKTWPAAGPNLAWTYKDAGAGFSSFAIVNDHLYTMGVRDKLEHLICLDIGKGKGTEVWSSKIDKPYTFKGNAWNDCPLGTPTVDDGMVYALGSQGVFVCVDIKGKEQWRKDLVKDFGGEVSVAGGSPPPLGWGYASSPLIAGNNVIVVSGGKKGLLAAFNKKTGALAWQSADVPLLATYSSPLLVTIEKVGQVVCQTQEGAVGVDPANGKMLWEYKVPGGFPDAVMPTPIYHEGKLFLTAWGGPAEQIEITLAGGKFNAKPVWSSKKLWNRQSGVVLVDGYLYGNHDLRNWVCLDWKTGNEMWSNRRFPVGSVVTADGKLYCVTEKTDTVAMLAASPKGFEELGSVQLPPTSPSKLRKPSGLLWTHPAIANGKLYVRDQEFIYCYEVK